MVIGDRIFPQSSMSELYKVQIENMEEWNEKDSYWEYKFNVRRRGTDLKI